MRNACLRVGWVRCVGPVLALCLVALPVVSGAAGPVASGSVAAAPSGELPSLLQRYAAARRAALKEQVCLGSSRCGSDEGRLMDAMETRRRVSQAVAELAEAGDAEAAYQRGLMSLQVMEEHAKRSAMELDLRSPGQSAHLRRLIATESATAQRYLGLAAQAGHASACRAMAGHLKERQGSSSSPSPLVAQLYLCAVRGFLGQADRNTALETYIAMRQALAPDAMELVEAYSLLFRAQSPTGPRQRVQPDTALQPGKREAP
ncbi:hypothetical protein [Hydrogenophaga sp.]|uniref:hypothetical protein n=1 Tax=Hydrogenophaga sp. TaxID=1904254 RepID=UPI003F6C969E